MGQLQTAATRQQEQRQNLGLGPNCLRQRTAVPNLAQRYWGRRVLGWSRPKPLGSQGLGGLEDFFFASLEESVESAGCASSTGFTGFPKSVAGAGSASSNKLVKSAAVRLVLGDPGGGTGVTSPTDGKSSNRLSKPLSVNAASPGGGAGTDSDRFSRMLSGRESLGGGTLGWRGLGCGAGGSSANRSSRLLGIAGGGARSGEFAGTPWDGAGEAGTAKSAENSSRLADASPTFSAGVSEGVAAGAAGGASVGDTAGDTAALPGPKPSRPETTGSEPSRPENRSSASRSPEKSLEKSPEKSSEKSSANESTNDSSTKDD